MDEHIGSDVGLGVIQHGFVRSVLVKDLQDLGYAPVVRVGVQLPVGKRSGAAETEKSIALALKGTAAAELLDIRLTL